MIYQLIIYLFVNSFIHSFQLWCFWPPCWCWMTSWSAGCLWATPPNWATSPPFSPSCRRLSTRRLPSSSSNTPWLPPRRPNRRRPIKRPRSQKWHWRATKRRFKIVIHAQFSWSKIFYCLYNRIYLNVDEIPASVVYKLTYLIYKFCHTL